MTSPSPATYKVGDIITIKNAIVTKLVYGVPQFETDGATIEKVGSLKVGDYVRTTGKSPNFGRVGELKTDELIVILPFDIYVPYEYDDLMLATEAEYLAHKKKEEVARLKGVSEDAMMAEIVRRHQKEKEVPASAPKKDGPMGTELDDYELSVNLGVLCYKCRLGCSASVDYMRNTRNPDLGYIRCHECQSFIKWH